MIITIANKMPSDERIIPVIAQLFLLFFSWIIPQTIPIKPITMLNIGAKTAGIVSIKAVTHIIPNIADAKPKQLFCAQLHSSFDMIMEGKESLKRFLIRYGMRRVFINELIR